MAPLTPTCPIKRYELAIAPLHLPSHPCSGLNRSEAGDAGMNIGPGGRRLRAPSAA